MPSIVVNSPVSSAPIDRLEVGVGWVRPGIAGIRTNLNPLSYVAYLSGGCFEGNKE